MASKEGTRQGRNVAAAVFYVGRGEGRRSACVSPVAVEVEGLFGPSVVATSARSAVGRRVFRERLLPESLDGSCGRCRNEMSESDGAV
ncbi:MAG: hypothetical protein U9Q03_00125 [Patescibacteria group bacterium]|nr:hypothetical protein [Patescibacteria group bacterium]